MKKFKFYLWYGYHDSRLFSTVLDEELNGCFKLIILTLLILINLKFSCHPYLPNHNEHTSPNHPL